MFKELEEYMTTICHQIENITEETTVKKRKINKRMVKWKSIITVMQNSLGRKNSLIFTVEN